MKFSLILPVFNVAPYLEKCIESCLQQDLPGQDYEVILINDGSSDGSEDICRRYALQHQIIRLHEQANAGLSAARNQGLAMARGELIWFIDSDDSIQSNVLKTIYEQFVQENLDIMGFTANEEIGGSLIPRARRSELGHQPMKGRDYLFMNHPICVWSYVFRKSFLLHHELQFLPKVYHEDEDFTIRALYLCRRIGFWNKAIYSVNLRHGSITRSVNPKKSHDLLRVAHSISTFVDTIVEKKYRPVFHNRIAVLVNSAHYHILLVDDKEKKKFQLELKGYRGLFRYMKKGSRLKYQLEGWLFSVLPGHTVVIFSFLLKVKRLFNKIFPGLSEPYFRQKLLFKTI